MELITPNKTKVYFKDSYTYGDKLEIESVLLDGVEVSGKTQEFSIDAGQMRKMKKKAVDILVTKIVIGDEVITSDFYSEIMGLPIEDGEMVMQTIDDLTAGDSKNLTQQK